MRLVFTAVSDWPSSSCSSWEKRRAVASWSSSMCQETRPSSAVCDSNRSMSCDTIRTVNTAKSSASSTAAAAKRERDLRSSREVRRSISACAAFELAVLGLEQAGHHAGEGAVVAEEVDRLEGLRIFGGEQTARFVREIDGRCAAAAPKARARRSARPRVQMRSMSRSASSSWAMMWS